MNNHAIRLNKLEQAIGSVPEPLNIIRLIVDPTAAGEQVVEAIAIGVDRTLTHFARELGETKDALCERVRRAMGWTTELPC